MCVLHVLCPPKYKGAGFGMLSACMSVSLRYVWTCVSLSPERLDELCSYSAFKCLFITARFPVNMIIPDSNIGSLQIGPKETKPKKKKLKFDVDFVETGFIVVRNSVTTIPRGLCTNKIKTIIFPCYRDAFLHFSNCPGFCDTDYDRCLFFCK